MADTAARLVGAWRLDRYTFRFDDGGEIFPLGEDATGLIVYTADGWFSGQMMAQGRPRFARGSGADKASGTDAEVRASFDGYVAYFARWDVDEQAGVVNHRMAGALLADWIGKVNVRRYEFRADGALVLSAPPSGVGGRRGHSVMVWKRPGPGEAGAGS